MSSQTRRRLRSSLPPVELRGPLLAGTLTLVAGWALLEFLPPLHVWLRGDIAFYENWGSWIAGHRLPYRDFSLEYPPGALPLFALPPYLRKLAGQHGAYDVWFRVIVLVIALVCLPVIAWVLGRLGATRRRAYAALGLAGASPALLGPISVSRYDYWPALLSLLGIAALVGGRPIVACALFSLGAVAKLYPVVLVPLALIELWRRGRGRAVSQGVGAALAVLAAGIGPFLVLAPHGLWWAAHRQLVRPVQVESLAAAVFAAAHMLAGAHLHVVKSSGSDNLVGTGPDLAGTLSSVASLLALVVVYVYYVRGPATRERLVTTAVAAVAVFIAFTKVFSPQYLIWLMPIVPLLGGRAGARAAGLFAVAVGLTQIWEPYRYYDYYSTFAPWLVTLVVVRDLLVVAIVVVLVRALAASEDDAEQLDPARASVGG